MTWIVVVISLSLLALLISIVRWATRKEPPIVIEKITEAELKSRQDLFAMNSLKAYTKPRRKGGTK